MIAVCVTFDIGPGRLDAFLPPVRAQAATSLAVEAACHRFDVCVDRAAGRVFLYEIYADRAAFDLHLGTPHFAAFDTAVADMVTAKAVAIYDLDAPATG